MLRRRQVLQGVAAAPLAGIPLATLLADPDLARAAAAELNEVSLDLPTGRTVKASLATPAKTPAPSMVLIHEFWGLNDQIKTMAAAFAEEGYLALAIDLYGGKVATTREVARAQMQAVKPAEATETLVGWIGWLKKHKASAGKIGTIGWCFGGGWSLNASIAAPVDATVIYYGRVDRDAEDLKKLKGPVLGHFATQDKSINKQMVGAFEAAMKKAGKLYTVYWYEADHAFANPTGARYDAEDAKLAWSRTLAFLEEQLS